MENKKRNHEIRVGVSQEELEVIKKKAKSYGKTMAGFLRYLGLNVTLKTEMTLKD